MADDRSLQFFIGVNVQKFLRGLETANQGVNKFTKNTESKLAKGFANSAKGMIKGFAAPLAALATAGTVYQAAKQVAELDAKITRMGIDSNMSTKEMLSFKEQILNTAIKSGAATDGILEMSDAALESSKNVKFVKDNMELMTAVMNATGATGKDVGDAMGSIYENTGLAGEELKNLMDRLYSFGKGTSREARLKEILPNMEQMVKTAKMMYGPKASTKQIGDFIITSMFTGSPEATSKMLMSLLTPKTRKHLKTLGMDVRKSISISDVLKAETQKFGNNRQAMIANLTEIFGKKNALALEKLVNEQEDYNKAINENRAGDLFQDANKQATSFAAGMNKVNAVFLKIADAALGPILADMAIQLSKIDPTALEGFARAAGGVAKVLVDIANGLITFGAAYDDLTSSAADWLMGGAQSQGGKAAMNTRQTAAMDAANKNIAEGKRKIAQGDVMGGRAQVRGGLAQGKWVMQNPQEFEGSGHGIADVFRNSENTLQGQLDQALNDAYDRGASQAVDKNGKATVPSIKQDINVYVDGDKKPSRSTTTTRVGTQNSVLEEKK